MKYQILFSGKNKKNIINLSVKFTQRVLKGNFYWRREEKTRTNQGKHSDQSQNDYINK